MKKLLIECTYVFEHPHIRSGIQRVVRNIISNLSATREIADAEPVVLRDGKVYRVEGFEEVVKTTLFSRILSWLGQLRARYDKHNWFSPTRIHMKLLYAQRSYWHYHANFVDRRPFRSSRNMRRIVYILFKIGELFIVLPKVLFSPFRLSHISDSALSEIEVHPDHVLVLLDSSWHCDFLNHVEKLKKKGVTLISVIYDLIPLTHPQFCDEGLVEVFGNWFHWVSRTADGFIAISKTIGENLKTYIQNGSPNPDADKRWYDHFYLGTELDLVAETHIVRSHVKKAFKNGTSVYLVVSTIEPRKNHSYLLDAFDRIWLCESAPVLCIVGSIGWKCQEIVQRVETHKEYGRRLFMLNDVNDAELEYCYQNAKCLLFSSYIEGFGLPLVEAMQRGLPAMGSDIPVFREVGGDFMAYFDLSNPDSLVLLIRDFERSNKLPAVRSIGEWSWPTWEDSTRQLLSKIVYHIGANEKNTISEQKK